MSYAGCELICAAAARAFAQDCVPLSAEFIKLEMPQNFLEELNAAIDEFAQAISDRNQSTASHVSATVGIDLALERGLNAVEELNVVVRNKLRDNPEALAEWTSASHVERRTRKKKADSPETGPQQPAGTSGQ